MGKDDQWKKDLIQDNGRITRRDFLEKSGKFIAYTSPVLTTLLTADKAFALSGDAYFEVQAQNPVTGTFTGMPAVGTPGATVTRTWQMNPVLDDFAIVQYQVYRVRILSAKRLPTFPVNVTITWARYSGGALDTFRWGPGPAAGSTQTISLPSGGGTLGVGGTIVDSGVGNNWPNIQVGLGFNGTAGIVTFEAPGTNVKGLRINIVRQGGEGPG